MKEYSNREINDFLYANIDALLIVSANEDKYKVIKASDNIIKGIGKEGSYNELVEKFWFHMSDNNSKIADEYQIFLPKMGEFKGKSAQKAYFEVDGERYAVQMLVYPINQKDGEYVFVLSVLDKAEIDRKAASEKKVKTIQNAYLFSMYVDLNKDIAGSINVSEISEDNMQYDVKYSEWRMMIVNMFLPEDQATFLEITEPDYLKAHLKPSKTLSYDCQMRNLEGEFIWVKLIFGRTETTSEQDFRFVFMVENIHESAMQLFSELKKYENLASRDSLTGIFNHGRIETELNNAINEMNATDKKVSLMMFDIDFFKHINDKFGHAVGDEILKSFVNCINEKLQNHNIKMGRWGGEEFVCICYDIDIDTTNKIAEEVRQTIADKLFDTVGNMTCSVGVASLNKEDTVKDAFTRLDKALYDAKDSGRNCVKLA